MTGNADWSEWQEAVGRWDLEGFSRRRDQNFRDDVHAPRPPALAEVDEDLLRNAWPSIMESSSFEVFLCPITRGVMTDPVVIADGYTYERSAIEFWLRSSWKSPFTGLELPNKGMIPNQALRTLLKSLIDAVQDRVGRAADASAKEACVESSGKLCQALESFMSSAHPPRSPAMFHELSAASSSRVDRVSASPERVDMVPSLHGVTLAAFNGTTYGIHYLVLAAGDDVIRLPHPDACDGWSFGLRLARGRHDTSRTGWFPENYLGPSTVGDRALRCSVSVAFNGSDFETDETEYLVVNQGDVVDAPTEGDEDGWVKARLVWSPSFLSGPDRLPNGSDLGKVGWLPASSLVKSLMGNRYFT